MYVTIGIAIWYLVAVVQRPGLGPRSDITISEGLSLFSFAPSGSHAPSGGYIHPPNGFSLHFSSSLLSLPKRGH